MSKQIDLVVVGLGYVGLPLVSAAVESRLRVVGFDIDSATVDRLNGGHSHVDDLSDTDIKELMARGFMATCDPSVLARTAAIVICVPTPLDETGSPDLSAVRGAAHTISSWLKPGQLVVLESTTYPGTTNDVVVPILEMSGLKVGVDFRVAYSPERVDPGNKVYGVRNTPKVVGGYDGASTEAACNLYSRFVETVIPVSGTREAEMTKLLENTYRHINIALVNEMAVFCHDLGINLWEVIDAARTKPFGFQAFYPGPGVGGHCIPIDPNYLSFKVRSLGYPFRFVELAQEISGHMPAYILSRLTRNLNEVEKSIKGSRVLLLGVTYKADIADERESPATPLARRLAEMGAIIEYHDPFVRSWNFGLNTIQRVSNHLASAREADLTVLLQKHAVYDVSEIVRNAKRVFDTRGAMTGANVERL